MDEHIDIRTYPIPNWSSRQLAAMQNGKWTYFYNSKNNEPVFNYNPYSSKTLTIVPQRSPGGMTNRSSNLNTSIQSKEQDNNNFSMNYDSYQLFQQSLKKEKMQQQIFLTPTLSKPEKKQPILKKRDNAKINETFVPSQTNIVDEIKPIIPITPDLSVKKNLKQNSEIIHSFNESNITNDERNEDNENLYFTMKRNDAKNHNAFHFYQERQRELLYNKKSKKLIDESILSDKSRQSISQLKRFQINDQHAFAFPTNSHQRRSQSSISSTKH